MVERKGATATNSKMMPWQHSDDPVAHGDTGAKGSGCECVMQEDGVLLDSGFPHDGGKAKEGLRAMYNSDTDQHTVQLIQRKHSFTDVVSRLYLRSRHSGRNAFEVEVVVHGVIMEVVVLATVVVHGRRGTWHHIV